jgi:hypothetical protein
MAVFFTKLEVRPTDQNAQAELVEGAYAHCWVLEDSPAAAYNKASYYVRRDEWDIVDKTAPVEVVEEDFANADLGLQQLKKAKKETIAIFYTAWSRDDKTSSGPTTLQRSGSFDLNRYLQSQKRLTNKARCLHFDSTGECKAPAKVHSLQKNGLLRMISQDSHVYVPSMNIGTMRKNAGTVVLERKGIAKVSTFAGFCAQHDSELFRPIDTMALAPTDQQVALYGYRSLCREVFAKENTFALIDEQLELGGHDRATRELLEEYRIGTSVGLSNLQRHKAAFDESLRCGSYQDLEYTLFIFRQPPLLAFSAVFYPKFDFLGRQVQGLADHTTNLDLMTVCSADMDDGWGLLFCWHKTSSTACREFLRSLATVIHEGRRVEAALLRMVVAFCENLAVAPRWWETLAEHERERFCDALSAGMNLFAPTPPDNLMADLELDAGWKIDSVRDGVAGK